VGDAVPHVVVEDLQRERLERRVHRRDLREHVDAVTVVLDHALDAAHLALDAMQPVDESGLVLREAGLGHDVTSARTLRKRRSRRLLPTTNRLEQAIAAAATIGFSSPA